LTHDAVIIALVLFLAARDRLTVVIAVDSLKRRQSILVVDDEHDIAFVVMMQLSDYYEFEAYTDPVRRWQASRRAGTT